MRMNKKVLTAYVLVKAIEQYAKNPVNELAYLSQDEARRIALELLDKYKTELGSLAAAA